MQSAAIALGSNLPSSFGNPDANLHEAVRRIAALGEIEAVSTFHRTAPVGYTDQPDFLNAVLLLATDLTPLDLMQALLSIELAMGRDRSSAVPAKGPRIIDLDLLLMGNAILELPSLTLPHPEMHTRRFVLEPLAEIASDWTHPTTGLTVANMLAAL